MTSKVNSRTILLIFLAVLCSLAGVYFLKRSLHKLPVIVQKPPAEKLVTVPLASRNLQAGTQLSLDDIALLKMTRNEMKKYPQIEDSFMTNPDQIIGRVIDEDIARGSTFDPSKFFPQGLGPGISDQITPGRRAVTISMPASSALIGFAGAGQRVDVLFNYGSGTGFSSEDIQRADSNYFADRVLGSGGVNVMPRKFDQRYDNPASGGIDAQTAATAKVVVHNARILALGNRSVPTPHAIGLSVKPSDIVLVTLSVEAEDVEILRIAERFGDLSLALCGAQEQDTATSDAISPGKKLADLVNLPRSSRRSITMYRGREKTQIHFNSDGNSVEERLVDSPRAYDPSSTPGYNPARNQPWPLPPTTTPGSTGLPVSTEAPSSGRLELDSQAELPSVQSSRTQPGVTAPRDDHTRHRSLSDELLLRAANKFRGPSDEAQAPVLNGAPGIEIWSAAEAESFNASTDKRSESIR